MYFESSFNQFEQHFLAEYMVIQGAPLTCSHILLTGGEGRGGGFRGIFWGLKFGQKGFILVYERRGDFLGREKKKQGIFWYFGVISAQINNTINAIY